jgi:hypothetical protein
VTATLTTGSAHGFDALVLQNAHLRAVILPSLGGRVWELEDLVRGRQWIWHRPDVPLRQMPLGSPYDDVWAGGWEELFPNDAAGLFEGRQLPDHGEWWTMAWNWTDVSTAGTAGVVLSAESTVVKASCTKTFRLAPDAPVLSVHYRIRSLEASPVHFLFKQHLPVHVTPDCRVQLPGGQCQAVDPDFGTTLRDGDVHAWPGVSGGVDLRVVPPPASRNREFVYVKDLAGPWCGVDDARAGASIRMEFEPARMPFVWLFLSYGGWRDVYTAVLEPCSNMPKGLPEAVRAGQSAVLNPGATFETVVTVRLDGLAGASA